MTHSCTDTFLNLTAEVSRACMWVFVINMFFQPEREACKINLNSFAAETRLYCARCRKCPGVFFFLISRSQQWNTGASIHSSSQLCCISLLTLICFPLLLNNRWIEKNNEFGIFGIIEFVTFSPVEFANGWWIHPNFTILLFFPYPFAEMMALRREGPKWLEVMYISQMPAVVISPSTCRRRNMKWNVLSSPTEKIWVACYDFMMVFPASGARRQTLSELTVVPLCWNSMPVVPDTTRLRAFIQCMKTKGTRKGRCSRWYMEPEKERDKLLTDLLKMPERQQ